MSVEINQKLNRFVEKYIKLIPYAWKLIDNRIKNNPNFRDLKNFLQKNPRIKKI